LNASYFSLKELTKYLKNKKTRPFLSQKGTREFVSPAVPPTLVITLGSCFLNAEMNGTRYFTRADSEGEFNLLSY